MAKCEICGKDISFGIQVSHSHRRSNRTWKPNIRRVKALVNGTPKRVYACTRCLRSGKVTRVSKACKKMSTEQSVLICLFQSSCMTSYGVSMPSSGSSRLPVSVMKITERRLFLPRIFSNIRRASSSGVLRSTNA